jgi:hypothetical protein
LTVAVGVLVGVLVDVTVGVRVKVLDRVMVSVADGVNVAVGGMGEDVRVGADVGEATGRIGAVTDPRSQASKSRGKIRSSFLSMDE